LIAIFNRVTHAATRKQKAQVLRVAYVVHIKSCQC